MLQFLCRCAIIDRTAARSGEKRRGGIMMQYDRAQLKLSVKAAIDRKSVV